MKRRRQRIRCASRPGRLSVARAWACVCLGLLLVPGVVRGETDAGTPVAPVSVQAPAGIVGARQQSAMRAALIGTWGARVGKQELVLVLESGGRYHLNGRQGAYRVDGSNLALMSGTEEQSYAFDLVAGDLLTASVLTLSGGDLSQPLKLSAQRTVRSPVAYLRELFEISPAEMRAKAQRVLVIIIMVLMSRLLIAGLRALSQWAIYSQRGPLKFIYVHNRNRSRTIHSLVLNLIKYVVYFSAFGRILTEMGVNYSTYLASLSVIGLAIGFGSQGLVQDIVTGFFIIFEGQFDVGDLVEISGQTGKVRELGMRMTTLRNAFGQTVVIPNRNIAVVGNYRQGALRAHVDTAFSDAETASRALSVLQALGGELHRQFDGVILTAPVASGPLEFSPGMCVVRLELGIWPGQQWVVDQQLLPRLRERLAQNGLDIAADRVVVFYQPPRPQPTITTSPFWNRFRPGAGT